MLQHPKRESLFHFWEDSTVINTLDKQQASLTVTKQRRSFRHKLFRLSEPSAQSSESKLSIRFWGEEPLNSKANQVTHTPRPLPTLNTKDTKEKQQGLTRREGRVNSRFHFPSKEVPHITSKQAAQYTFSIVCPFK